MGFDANGNLRIRGKRPNIKSFLQEELVPVYSLKNGLFEDRPILLTENCGGWELILTRDPETEQEVYFKGSDQYFVDMECEEYVVSFPKNKNVKDDQVIYIGGFCGPSNPECEFFRKKAMRHKVDIRLFLFGVTKEWSNVITWYRNGEVKEHYIKYADWIWENPRPDMEDIFFSEEPFVPKKGE